MNSGNSVTPTIEIESFIVNPTFNGGSNQGPNILTFDPSASVPGGIPVGFQAINFNGPAHPNDPASYNEIIAAGNWWTDNPTTFFHQNASIDLAPQLAGREKIYVLEYTTGSNVAVDSTENFGTRIGIFDDKNQGVFLGQNFNTKAAGSSFLRGNFLNVHRVNADGENVHIETIDNRFSSGHKNLSYGNTVGVTPPTLDLTDFRIKGQDQTGILGHLFENEAVIRLHTLDEGRMSIEWYSAESVPTDPGDPFSTPYGGDSGPRPERDGWHNYPVVENIFDLSGPDPVAIEDFVKLRVSMWNPSRSNGLAVSDLSTIYTANLPISGNPDVRTNNNHQLGFGRIAVKEYHKGDVNRDGAVTSADVTDNLLANLNILSDRVWKDGDVTDDMAVTVADALAGVLTGLAGVAPTGPELVYTSGTGNLKINTAGASLSGFALVAAAGQNFNSGVYTNPNPNPASAIQTVRPAELSWMNLTAGGAVAGSNLSAAMINLGNVMPIGLTPEQFEDFFAEAVFNVGSALTKANSFFATEVPVLAGDYNNDGLVNMADYTVWRDNLGSATPLPNDPLGGTIGAAQYNQWKTNFGAAAPAAIATAAVPEPSGVVAGVIAGLCVLVAVRRSPFKIDERQAVNR